MSDLVRIHIVGFLMTRLILDMCDHMSLVLRKPAFCICENKDPDQLCGNREADQRLCFRFTDSKIPLLPKNEISSIWPSSVAAQPDLCGTWFSHNEAHMSSIVQDFPTGVWFLSSMNSKTVVHSRLIDAPSESSSCLIYFCMTIQDFRLPFPTDLTTVRSLSGMEYEIFAQYYVVGSKQIF